MPQGPATDSATLLGQGATRGPQDAIGQTEAILTGVDRNHPRQSLLVGQSGDGINGVIFQIRGDLDQQRRTAGQSPKPFDQAPQLGFLLQFPQAGGVGGADIDHRVVRQRRQ